MKIVFVGIGGIGSRHARNARALLPRASMLAVRAEHNETTRALGMSLLADVTAAVAGRPDAAVIALPPALHADTAGRFLDADVAVYLEKPVAVRRADLESAAAGADARGVVSQAGCNLRFLGAIREVQDLLARGTIGPVVHAHLSAGGWLPDWRPGRDYRDTYSAKAALGGGVIRDLCHELDLARFLFGEFDQVTAAAGRSGLLEIDTEDWADIVLRRGAVAVGVHVDYLDRAAGRRGRIIGSSGSISYDLGAGEIHVMGNGDADRRHRFDGDSTAFDIRRSERDALAHFLDCVERGTPTGQSISDGLATVDLASRARAAAGLDSAAP